MSDSYFQRVRWHHDNAEDPVVLWAHVVDGWEVRKVDEFADGRLAWADEEHAMATTALGQVPIPLPDEIAVDPQLSASRRGLRCVTRAARCSSRRLLRPSGGVAALSGADSR
ncbi:hypothetical protein AB6N24_08395 [Cellulomonas sp. 179-A 4D5 NHS]|uniref:DUF6881 domain-containing protein n=1 Tax=Cellulomonas sp. 179-A 4D5 NHS TaxID=3142378 RepID=UPI0039A205AF